MTRDYTTPLRVTKYKAAKWASDNPVVAKDVLAVETDTNRAKIGDGTSQYNSLSYAFGGPAPLASSVSGAVSVDLSKSETQLLTLTGNVTSFTVTNPPEGKNVEIEFIQDGTGSRTLAGVVSAAVKLAGGALTLTTAANKRDVLRFRVVGGVLQEASRSLNV